MALALLQFVLTAAACFALWRLSRRVAAANARISGMVTPPETRPQLTIRKAHEGDAAALREIFNEAVEDRLTTFEVAPRSLTVS